MDDKKLPLAGIRVVEFTHMVMGPSCGLILGDLGADVVKVEPIAGDSTRRLKGLASGFFPTFNRNKKSIALKLDSDEGLAVARRLAAAADIVSENFKSETMERQGLDYASLARENPRLIYVSHKGFLPGPYEKRTALDEVVQMMGGLAYMTGPEGKPLRAGSSVNDIMGGMFGAIGAMAALRERDATGRGQLVQSGLFENNVFLVAQHMMQYAVTGQPAPPMPSRVPAWGIYDVFGFPDGGQLFLAVVSDTQWKLFCDAFGFADLLADARYASNNARVAARDTLLPLVRERLAALPMALVEQRFAQAQLPHARIAKPHELFDDPHLNASGGLAPVQVGEQRAVASKMPLLPLRMDGERLDLRLEPPLVGEHTDEILAACGYGAAEIAGLKQRGIAA